MRRHKKAGPDVFADLSEAAREEWLGEAVAREQAPLTGLRFLREYVAPNRPVVVEGALAAAGWPLHDDAWSFASLQQRLGDTTFSVAFTPNGRADAVTRVMVDGQERELFMEPAEKQLTMAELAALFKQAQSVRRGAASAPVVYLQKQNDNLRTELPLLLPDNLHLPWVEEALGTEPDAVNFWLGDARSVSSLHKDPYENVYAVVSGTKTFVLFPPFDLPHLHEERFVKGHYTYQDGVFGVEVDQPEESVPWIAVDPERPDHARYPHFHKAKPFYVEVHAGDILYLPSLWYHQVGQIGDDEGKTVAINLWYDMQFDFKWSYYCFLRNLLQTYGRTLPLLQEPDDDDDDDADDGADSKDAQGASSTSTTRSDGDGSSSSSSSSSSTTAHV